MLAQLSKLTAAAFVRLSATFAAIAAQGRRLSQIFHMRLTSCRHHVELGRHHRTRVDAPVLQTFSLLPPPDA